MKNIYCIGLLLTIFIMSGCSKDNPAGPTDNGLQAVGCVVKQGDVELVRAEKNVAGEFHVEERMQSVALSFYLIDKNGKLFQPAVNEYTLAWTVKDQMLADLIQYQDDGAWSFRIKAFEAGTTTVSFHLLDDDFESLDIPIIVAESAGGGLNK